MDIKNMPILLLLLTTFLLVVGSTELGHRIGAAIKKKREVESESTVSSISGYVLALLAFIIAFTFSIVTDRYQVRKELVREEANIIRSAWMRSDFLTDSQRIESKNLLKEYTGLRLAAVLSRDDAEVEKAMGRSAHIQEQLWNIAVANAQKDLNSDVGALYIESINDIVNINASRIVVGLHSRLPEGIWNVLLILTLIAMLTVGYQTAIVGSRRSWATLLMAISFCLVIVMIEALDRAHTRLIPVSQFPLQYLMESFNTDAPSN